MSRFVVQGGRELAGEVCLSGAKNSALKLMAATLLSEGETRLDNVPEIADVKTMGDLLSAVGCGVDRDGRSLVIKAPASPVPEAPYELVERMRASVVVLGPLLARCGQARVSMPGGDDLGARPIDIHLRGLEALGAEVNLEHGWVSAKADRLIGTEIVLDYPSVGATENIMMAAVLAEGQTVIDNAAREPEIVDLCELLCAMGAQISGAGSPTLKIDGVERETLRGVSHRVIPDRVEAATYMAAVGVAGGEITISDTRAAHLEMLIAKVATMGLDCAIDGDALSVRRAGARLHSVDVATLPYPGVATDYKPFLVTMLSVADGVGIVTENLYQDRFRYLGELVRMGANVRHEGHHTIVRGVPRLSGARVKAHDIRAGAALIVAGLGAEGETVVERGYHVDRGYADLAANLRSLGASVTHEAD